MIECSWKSTLGIPCPGCGAQRSVIALFEGHFWESIQLFPALLPLMAVVVLTALHLRLRFEHGARWILRLFVLSVALMVGNWTFQLFGGEF